MQVEEQVAATQQANIEMFFQLSRAYAESVDKLTRLGMETIRSTLDEALDLSRKAVSVKEPQEWWTLQSNRFALAGERAQACHRQLLDIGASGQAQCARLMQTQVEMYGRQAKALMEGIAQSAPASSVPVVTALDSVLTAANRLYETLQQTGQQAVEVTRSNFDLATSAASKSGNRAIESMTQAVKR